MNDNLKQLAKELSEWHLHEAKHLEGFGKNQASVFHEEQATIIRSLISEIERLSAHHIETEGERIAKAFNKKQYSKHVDCNYPAYLAQAKEIIHTLLAERE
jgi:hypothetical protein